jgi:hypothetical protein
MLLTQDKMKLLIETLVLTRDDEVDCDGCFEFMAEFAENELAGCSVPEALAAIDHHLKLCGDCVEEFKLLKQSLSDIAEDA